MRVFHSVRFPGPGCSSPAGIFADVRSNLLRAWLATHIPKSLTFADAALPGVQSLAQNHDRDCNWRGLYQDSQQPQHRKRCRYPWSLFLSITHRLTSPGGLALLHPLPQYLHAVCPAVSASDPIGPFLEMGYWLSHATQEHAAPGPGCLQAEHQTLQYS